MTISEKKTFYIVKLLKVMTISEKKTFYIVKAFPSLNIEAYSTVMKKFSMTNFDAIHYLREKERIFLEKGDLDMAMAARSLLREYSSPGIFTLNDLFTDRFLAKYPIHPLKYDKFYNRYDLLKVKNFSLYNLSFNPQHFFLSSDLSDQIAEGLWTKLTNFLYNNLGLKPDKAIFLQYAPLLNNLLSIASSMYFEGLSLEEKLHLINQDLTIDVLINLIEKLEIKDDYETWRKTATIFNIHGAPEFGLKIMKILKQRWETYIKNEDKYQFFDTLASIYRNLQFYGKALHFYMQAWDTHSIIEKTRIIPIRSNEKLGTDGDVP